MRRKIKGKIYDTETAKFVGIVSDTDYKVLYKTKRGHYFYYYEKESGPDYIEPCHDNDGWIEEIFGDYESYHLSYIEWEKQKEALEVVKDYVKNIVTSPFSGDFKVVKRGNAIVFYVSKNKYFKIDLGSEAFTFDLPLEQYHLCYDIGKNRDNIILLFNREMDYKMPEELEE